MDGCRSENALLSKKPKKIEDDLFKRHKEVRRKIDALKTKKINAQLKSNQQTPIINSLSKRIASKTNKEIKLLHSPTRVQRTHEILQNSKFMPKKIRLSLSSLKLAANTCKSIPMKPCRYDTALSAPRSDSPITFPSLQMPLTARDPDISNDLPPDISKRNELLSTLRTHIPDNSLEPNYGNLTVAERTALWLQRKQEKIKQMRAKKDSKATSGCTFRPQLSTTLRHSSKSTQRSLSVRSSFSVHNFKKPLRTISVNSFAHSEKAHSVRNSSSETLKNYRNSSTSALGSNAYSAICPVSMSLSYSSGYSHDFKKRAKPLIDYKSLNYIPR
ncbi:hypothetical protein SteCoe_29097 [Stentor coeruleus]|uniref:Uncharacterized protein n=1 Tax=Stentor coeruleus TaxID=5963 RepID=A0A1R2B6R6_9CILI|nr:hypothetical protein SteCoe_29097 [Stentor coeruleus]